MKTFHFQDWADFVRGVASPDKHREMQELLSSGHAESLRWHHLAAQLQSGLRDFSAVEVPPGVFARGKAVFQPHEKQLVSRLPLLPVQLLFDSFLTPQAAGFRTTASHQRETVHAAGDLQVSLRYEQEPGTDFMAVVGQLQPGQSDGNHAPLPTSFIGCPVFVFHKDQMIARTLSGPNGEFQLEFSGRHPLRLVVALDVPAARLELELVPFHSKGPKRSGGDLNQ